ncbi:MAG: 5-(carboxyamino)imidazole ribonucleotide synthase [Limnochordia bacterium]|jgi:5-(carboxyamino)imidazole ribonucleotide synthase
MERYLPPAQIGILGGGQLGKMLAQAAKRMGYRVLILDPQENSPAAQVADGQMVAGFYDRSQLAALVRASHVTTYEIEHVDTEILKELRDEGYTIDPWPEILEVIQDKLRQKEVLAAAGLPTGRFAPADIPDAQAFAQFGYPLVQKARKGGYDGRGVALVRHPGELDGALPVPSVLEEMVDVDKELAVMVARGRDGALCSYPVVEMIVDERANMLDLALAPAPIDEETARRAQELAEGTVEALGGVGIFGVEMFLSKAGELIVNEVAPRPHNSGHYTIEACVTDQFEQHLRAVAGLPLGDTTLLRPAVMVNLVGAPGYTGAPVVEGLAEVLALPGTAVHIYGKGETRPYRKMGHVTVVAEDLDGALEKALQVKGMLQIKGERFDA